MLSRIWVINLVLAILIGISWMGIWKIRHAGQPPITDAGVLPQAETASQKSKAVDKKMQESSAYDAIVTKNLFSPERMANMADLASSPAVEDLRVSGEKIMLFGVVMVDDYKAAMINNPGKESDGKEYRWVKEGEQISNLKVVKIQKDQISINDGALQYKISLFDPNKAKNKDAAAPSREESKGLISGEREAQSAQKTQAPASAPETGASVQPRDGPKIVGADRPPQSGKTQAPQTKEKVKTSEDGQYEIIDTPFGSIQRKKK